MSKLHTTFEAAWNEVKVAQQQSRGSSATGEHKPVPEGEGHRRSSGVLKLGGKVCGQVTACAVSVVVCDRAGAAVDRKSVV